jgi:hypothetical protein
MRLKTTITPLPAKNDFKIENHEDYSLIEVTASEGKHAVTMSFPWCTELPYGDVHVQDAIEKCKETTRASLLQHLEREDKKLPVAQRILRALRREIEFMWNERTRLTK